MTEIIPEAPASLWRKRPVTVPAIRWTGSNLAEVQEFTGGPQWFAPVAPEDREDDPERTAEVFDKLHSTWVGVHDGQWVIRGVKDELYPCDDEVLRETYEPVPAGVPAVTTPPPPPASATQAALLALVAAHFIGDGPHPLQLVCFTEDASDVECDQTIALVEPGVTWDELEARMAAHAAECHAPARPEATPPPHALADRLLTEADSLDQLSRKPESLADKPHWNRIRGRVASLRYSAAEIRALAGPWAALAASARDYAVKAAQACGARDDAQDERDRLAGELAETRNALILAMTAAREMSDEFATWTVTPEDQERITAWRQQAGLDGGGTGA